jgi:hypothetical protein
MKFKYRHNLEINETLCSPGEIPKRENLFKDIFRTKIDSPDFNFINFESIFNV